MANWLSLKNDPKNWNPIFIKEYLIKGIRNFFTQKEFHELDSPILASMLPQERYLDVLETIISDKKGNAITKYLIPSTERYNKLALCARLGNHYVISKVFRGLEEIGPNHLNEFSMLEWYEVGYNYEDLMQTTEDLIIYVKRYIDEKLKIIPEQYIDFQTQKISLEKPFARLSISEALSKYSGIELGQIQDLKTFQKIALKKHYSNASEYDWQTIFELIFANEIEPHIIPDKPCFLFDYPKQLCPLTKIKSGNSLVAEKVELYIGGKEIGNGYSEQTDWETQKLRFEDEKIARKAMNKKNVAFDSELIEALKHGMPEAAGMGLGIDRLAMILSNSQSINQVNLT